MIDIKVTIKDVKLKTLTKDIKHGTGKVRQAYKRWGQIFAKFLKDRYRRFSSGGGTWKRLKPATIRRKGHALILRDTDTLLNAVGRQVKQLPRGVEVGIQDGPHPRGGTIRAIANAHQTGYAARRLPRRKIMVPPYATTIEEMTRVMAKAIEETVA